MRRRPGFTLLELTIVVSMIAILIALLLPAVQAAREAARRSQCANNLMQLGIAMGSYVSTHSVLPPGVVNASGPIRNLPEGYHHGWVVQILPFIGQQNLYNHFDLNESVYDPANDTATGIKIATLICPSDGRRGPVNYAGCHHDALAPIASDNQGVLYLNSKVRFDEINDGRAYTILLGEIRHGGATLGWGSGTHSTLRNTAAAPLNPSTNRLGAGQPDRNMARYNTPLGSSTLLDWRRTSGGGRIVACRPHGRLRKQPSQRVQLSVLRRFGALCERHD